MAEIIEFDIVVSGSVLHVSVSGDAKDQFKKDVTRLYLRKHDKKSRPGPQKLTEAQVKEIRRLHSEYGWGRLRLSRKFDVGKTTIEKIIKRITWKDVI
jgi:hypothetical protein